MKIFFNFKTCCAVLCCLALLGLASCSSDDSSSSGSSGGQTSRGLSVELKNMAGGAWLLMQATGSKDGKSVSATRVSELTKLAAPVLLAISSADTTFTAYAPVLEEGAAETDYTTWTWQQKGVGSTSGHGPVRIISGMLTLIDDWQPAIDSDCTLAMRVVELTETSMTCSYLFESTGEQIACRYTRLGYNPAANKQEEDANTNNPGEQLTPKQSN